MIGYDRRISGCRAAQGLERLGHKRVAGQLAAIDDDKEITKKLVAQKVTRKPGASINSESSGNPEAEAGNAT